MKRHFGLRGGRLNHATIALVAAPGFFCYGWNQAVAGGILTLKSFSLQFPLMDTEYTSGAQLAHNTTIQGTVVALYALGGMFGALSCIYLGNRLGRRRTIFLASGVTIIGAVLMASSYELAQFIVARLVLGLGTGGTTAIIPVSEGIFIGGGITIALWVDLALYFVNNSSVAWRFPLALQIVFSLMVMAFVFTMPESPRWLLSQGREEEAREILAILDDSDLQTDTVNRDIDNIQRSIEATKSGSYFDMLKQGKQRMLNRTCLAVGTQVFQQMCGVNLITFYATTIFQEDLGLDATRSRILAAAMEVMQPIGAVVALFTIERFGRRKLMLFGGAGLGICMSILAGTTAYPNNSQAAVAAVVFLFLFNGIFPIGFLGIPYLYATEVAPQQLRAPISGLSVAATWLFNFLVAEITPVGFDTIHYRYYIIYACINAAIVPTVYFCYPETAGLSLEEVDEVFVRSKNVFDSPRVAATMARERASRADLETPEDTKAGGVELLERRD